MSAVTIDRDQLRQALADGLQRLSGQPWTLAGDGILRSPESSAVFVTDLEHDESHEPGHVDIGFAVNLENPEAPVLWDCAGGVGASPAAAAEFAARIWLDTTGHALLEFYERRGRLAEHFAEDDPDGLPGMHVLYSPVLAFGADDGGPLQRWAINALRGLRDTLPARLTGALHGVKLLFGGCVGAEVAEVRVDGVYDDDSSRALADLPWPRPEKPTFARAYLLVMPSAD